MRYRARKIYVSCDRAAIARWADYLNGHREESKQSLAQEGVRHEAWWMGRDEGGLFLVAALDVEDLEKARAVFEASTLSVDQVHRDFMKQWDRRIDLDIEGSSAPTFPDYELLIDMRPTGD